MNIPFIGYVLYHSCIKASEEEQKKTIADVEKLEDQHSSSFSSHSSQSSRASSPLPSGFSDLSADESELLEEFFKDSNFNEIPSNHDSSSSSSWNISSSQSPSQHSEDMEEDSLF